MRAQVQGLQAVADSALPACQPAATIMHACRQCTRSICLWTYNLSHDPCWYTLWKQTLVCLCIITLAAVHMCWKYLVVTGCETARAVQDVLQQTCAAGQGNEAHSKAADPLSLIPEDFDSMAFLPRSNFFISCTGCHCTPSCGILHM